VDASARKRPARGVGGWASKWPSARRSDKGRVTLGGLFREHAHGVVLFLYTRSVFCVALALSGFSPRGRRFLRLTR
jgi:hypothetical protein